MPNQPIRSGTRAAYGSPARESVLATNKVLRNTYALLSMTLLFSAAMAGVSVVFNVPYFGPIVTLAGYFGLLFLTTKFRNSAAGIACVFALTGFMGLTLGPLLSLYLQTADGANLVMTALGSTGLVFLGLSAYALKSQRDFSFMGGFLMVGMFGLLAVILLGLFIDLSGLQMAISAGVVLLMSALILYETSSIIHGGETNYIMATVSLFVSIYNLFTNLLFLLGMGGDD
ncbi:MAG: Bax inhibitor-1/YccA family protein [Gammaproteobacteria bacterium]|jgi:modulator of FtsH protease|nr:Bax inhibitor-1/YccA family protein [Gammaproteobacteria bacterium]